MKNLAKVVMSLAVVMLISASAFAQYVDPEDDYGTVTLTVQEYMVFDLIDEALIFDFHKLDANNPEAQTTTVSVKSNVAAWTASVKATSSDLVGIEGLGIDVLTLNGIAMAMNSAVPFSGAMTADKVFSYDFNISGNPIPGSYVTNLTYSVTKD